MSDSIFRSRIVGHGEEAPDQLLANPSNWRIHPKAQQDALAGVLEEVGWVQSVIVNRTTGNLVDGHLRVSLALREGTPTIPVVYVELTPEEENLVLATIDPIGAMAATDKAQLETLLSEVSTSSPAVRDLFESMGKGFWEKPDWTDEQLDAASKDPITKVGDLWKIGPHRILCGDSSDVENLNRLIGGSKVGCVLSDPPYGIDLYGGGFRTVDDEKRQRINSKTDSDHALNVHENAYRPVIGDQNGYDGSIHQEYFKKTAEQFWFGANYYRRTMSPSDMDGSWMVWDKRTENSEKIIGSHFELVWSKKGHGMVMLRHHWVGAFATNKSEGFEREHPTEKPIALLADIIKRWVDDGVVIVDPFAGSGTTLLAAARTGRVGYGIELDPRYVDVIVRRLEKQTGETAVREE